MQVLVVVIIYIFGHLKDERINSITASNYSITLELSYYNSKIKVKFNGSSLKQDKVTYNHGKTINIYIVYEISKNYISNYPTLENCLSGAISLTKHADIDQNKYSGYGTGFDRKGCMQWIRMKLYNFWCRFEFLCTC